MLRRFFRQAYLATTDFEVYPRILEQPFRHTLIFLLFLAGLLSVILTLVYAWQYNPAVSDFFTWAETNIPPFEVKDGKLTVQTSEPVLVRYRDNGSTWTFVFDTTGTYKNPENLEEPALLFTQETLQIRMQGQTQTYLLSDFGEFSIHSGNLESYRTLLNTLYFPFAYAFLLIGSLLAKTVQAIILSPLAYSVGAGYGIRLSFQNCFTIGLYSLIPAIIIDLGVTMTGLSISYFDIIYLVVAAIYTFLATQKCVMAH